MMTPADLVANVSDFLRPLPYVVPRRSTIEVERIRRRASYRLYFTEWNERTPTRVRDFLDTQVDRTPYREAPRSDEALGVQIAA